MIGSILGLIGALSVPAIAGVQLQRVEILSEDPGTWLHYELPMAASRPSTAAVRLIEQIQPVWQSPWTDIYIGTSLTVQTLQIERPLGDESLRWSAGIQTALLCPKGVVGALHWQRKRLHLSAGLSLSSMASWQHRSWNQWTLLPTAGIGISR